MGGTASLVAAADVPVDGVATLSAPTAFMGLAASPDVVGSIDGPTLFVAARDDPAGAASSARTLYDAATEPKQVEIVAGEEHGTDLLHGGEAERVQQLLLDFLRGIR
jgi:esterase/lipase